MDREAVAYGGGGFTVPVFGGYAGTLTPPNVIDQNPRAHLLLWQPGVGASDVTFTDPQAGFFASASAPVAISGEVSVTVPPDALQPAAPSCSVTSCAIDTGDGRFTNDSTQYGDHLWATHTTGISGFSVPAWYDIDTEGAGANAMKQSGSTFFSQTAYDFNASIVAAASGRVILNWSFTDPDSSIYPSMAFTGRLASDPANTVNHASFVFIGSFKLMGNFDAVVGAQRWGETSSVRFDPITPAAPTRSTRRCRAPACGGPGRRR